MKSTHISGHEPSYANYTIVLYKTVDPFDLLPQKVGTIKVDPIGNFELNLVLENTTYVYADFDRWHASTIFEPGKDYIMQLPPNEPLVEAEKRSPYFTSSPIPFGLKELPTTDINRQIQAFEIAFATIEDKYFDELFTHKSSKALQALKSEILRDFPAPSYTFFGQYIYYRLASVEYKLRLTNDNEFIEQYMNVSILPFNVPSFNALYKEVFTNYFYNEVVLKKNLALKQAMVSGKLSNIEAYLHNQNSWGEDLVRVSILDGINDSFYLNLYPKYVLLDLLKQIQSSNWPNRFKKLALEMHKRLTFLAVDSKVPDISLSDYNSKPLKLNSILDSTKINFLHFSNTNNPICRSHLDQITNQYDVYSKYVEFIIIMPESCREKIDYQTLSSWKGKFFFASDEELAKYDIRSFPYSFIASKEGKFLVSPALNPLEGMIDQLNTIIFKQRRDQLTK